MKPGELDEGSDLLGTLRLVQSELLWHWVSQSISRISECLC